MGLIKSDVSFEVNGVLVSFSIVHDLPDTPGLSFDDALQNWLARANEFTAESFCKYVLSKNTGHTVLTEDQYKKIKNRTKPC